MKIGIVGMGSIGRRHARCLTSTGGVEIVALRTRRGALGDLPADLAHVEQTTDPDRFYDSVDGVIVCTPTALHAEAVRHAARRSLPTLVEKPLCATAAEVADVPAAARERVRVAYCLRFHDVVRTVRSILAAGRIGRVYRARLTAASYLPSWHPDVDYRIEYMSRKDLGGGVARTSSHEIDLAQHWLGRIVAVTGDVRRVSDLEIDVDDVAILACRTETGASALIELDYVTRKPIRSGYVVGADGRVEYDLVQGTVDSITMAGSERVLAVAPAEALERMYLDQTRDFLEFCRTGTSEAARFEDALSTTRVVEAAEKTPMQEIAP